MSICLNMIVRNEAEVIRRCLASVLPLIDCWLIVDTGSTDGTQAIIRDYLQDLPGELVERPWVDFGHNRSEAIALAGNAADYLFIIDADEVLEEADLLKERLKNRLAEQIDAYSLDVQHGASVYSRTCLISTRLEWRFIGVLHEYLDAGRQTTTMHLSGPRIVPHQDGGRGRGRTTVEKYADDAKILEKALASEPGNSRYAFYLAQSYRDSGQKEKALSAYLGRAEMGGWEEEIWASLFESARLTEALAYPSASIVQAYLAAFSYRPSRAEPLVALARFHRSRREFALAYLFSAQAITIQRPDDKLFIDTSVYDWRALDEFAVASYWTGDYETSLAACNRLRRSNLLPASERDRVMKNLSFALAKSPYSH